MQDMLELVCDEHPEDACPDQIIVCATEGKLAIPIYDGGDEAIGIDFCPWCGTPATVEAWSADVSTGEKTLRRAAILLEQESTRRDWGTDLPGLTDSVIHLRYFADKIYGLEQGEHQGDQQG